MPGLARRSIFIKNVDMAKYFIIIGVCDVSRSSSNRSVLVIFVVSSHIVIVIDLYIECRG